MDILERLEQTKEYKAYKQNTLRRTIVFGIWSVVMWILFFYIFLLYRPGNLISVAFAIMLVIFDVAIALVAMQALKPPRFVCDGTITAIRTMSDSNMSAIRTGSMGAKYETVSSFVYQVTGKDGAFWGKDPCPPSSRLSQGSHAAYFDMGFGCKYVVPLPEDATFDKEIGL